jgi:hypothetical protein
MSLGIIYAPTDKMIKYANDLASQTGAALPPGYDQSYEVCHNFLDQNAPRKLDDCARAALRALAPQIISSFLGEPNRRLSNRRQLRWHSKGSLALQLTGKHAGCWYDHANKALATRITDQPTLAGIDSLIAELRPKRPLFIRPAIDMRLENQIFPTEAALRN